jgi:cytochrome c2
MWNHSGKMYGEMERAGINWPNLSSQNVVDLIAYFRSLPEARSQSAAFQPGDPELGRITFESRCESCHSFGTRTAVRKIDLLKTPGPHTMTDYAAAMWNHAPLMHKRAGSDFPILVPGEMGNLVAYLFAQRYFFEEGDTALGAIVFKSKNCVLCHEQQRQTGAPDLRLATERYSPITMSSAVWRHGPAMFEKMGQQNIGWPQFSGPEMSNLIAYLNSRLIQKNAN